MNPNLQPDLSLEQKLYRVLKRMDKNFVSSYMASFGIPSEKIEKTAPLKNLADSMSEENFISQNDLKPLLTSSTEIELLYQGITGAFQDLEEC